MTYNSPINHGTATPYNSKRCRCEYCTAASRVTKRAQRQGTNAAPLLAAIREAALEGSPLPEEALAQTGGREKFSPPIRKRSEDEKAATSREAEEVATAAHQARLRAVEHAEGDVAKLAILSVAEFTSDPLREMRYRRVVDAL